jgi:hypothetical protein
MVEDEPHQRPVTGTISSPIPEIPMKFIQSTHDEYSFQRSYLATGISVLIVSLRSLSHNYATRRSRISLASFEVLEFRIMIFLVTA